MKRAGKVFFSLDSVLAYALGPQQEHRMFLGYWQRNVASMQSAKDNKEGSKGYNRRGPWLYRKRRRNLISGDLCD